MVEVERLEDGALLLNVDPALAGAINTVLVKKGVRVSELRKQTTAKQCKLAPSNATPAGSPVVNEVVLKHGNHEEEVISSGEDFDRGA